MDVRRTYWNSLSSRILLHVILKTSTVDYYEKKRTCIRREGFDEMKSQGRWRLDVSSAVRELHLDKFMRLFKLFFLALHCIFNGSLTATI